MRIASWNVNSIKVRGQQVADWLHASDTDVLLIQELKCQDDAFPHQLFSDIGYQVIVHGQKTYNGVAIASRLPMQERRRGLPGCDGKAATEDEQARYLEVLIESVVIGCLYLPNGNPVNDPESGAISAKFDYKLSWMERLACHIERLDREALPLVLGGDYNIIPQACDCHDIDAWRGDALHRPESMAAWRRLRWLGMQDAFRVIHPAIMAFSYWDYQGGAWQKDHGIRIDHLLLNAEATDLLVDAGIDKGPRNNERASDHTPAWCQLNTQSKTKAT